MRLLLVASPDYLERHGRPTHPAELSRHCALAYTGGATRGVWRFVHPGFGEAAVEPPVRLWTDNADLLTPALIAGHGLAIQPEFLVWREVRDGSLEIAMPDWNAPPLALHLVMPGAALRPLRVQVVIDHLTAMLSSAPWAAK